MKKRITSLIIVIALVFSVATFTFAAQEETFTAQAETLKSLGLFLGSEIGFELDRTATRAEIAVMMVRLLGKEAEAKQAKLTHPFSDVPEWATDYIGYLYKNGITKGVSETAFGAADPATVTQYATLVLRALKYDDDQGDFTWDKALVKTKELGFFGSGSPDYSDSDPAIRGYVVNISYLGLFVKEKGTDNLLLEKLYSVDKSITREQMKAAASDAKISAITNVLGIPSPALAAPLTSEEVFAKASSAVFFVDMLDYQEESIANASGFFISSDGLAITNIHVILSAQAASIRTTDGKSYKIESVLAVDASNDFALIKIAGNNFPYLTIGDSDALRPAQRIYCIGSPLGLENTISEGLVSNVNRVYEGRNFIQISAAIFHGSSGGALLNEYGQVVGVTSAGFEDTTLNFAVPIKVMETVDYFSGPRSLNYFTIHTNYDYIPVSDTTTIESGDNNEAAIQTIPHDSILYGALSGGRDVDYYKFSVASAGDVLVSVVSNKTISRDIKFEIINANNKETVFTSVHYTNDEFSYVAGHLFAGGDYYIRVYSDNGNLSQDLAYELYYCFQETTKTPNLKLVYEFEPNNDLAHANYFAGGAIMGSIASADDKDCFSFSVDKTTEFTLGTISDFGPSEMKIELYDQSGRQVTLTGDEYQSIPAGTYHIIMTPQSRNFDWTNNGWYVLVVMPKSSLS